MDQLLQLQYGSDGTTGHIYDANPKPFSPHDFDAVIQQPQVIEQITHQQLKTAIHQQQFLNKEKHNLQH